MSGACWAVIQARGRLILFGLYPYEEHWRSTLACLAIVLTMGLSCLPWFWGLKRLPALWLAGFGTFMMLMYGGVLRAAGGHDRAVGRAVAHRVHLLLRWS